MPSPGCARAGLAIALCSLGCSSGSTAAADAARLLRDAGPSEVGPEAAAADTPPANASFDAGCTGWTTLARLTPAEAKALIDTSHPVVINVHVPYEGDIPGTAVDIPYDNVDAIAAYLDHDLCADVLLVCKTGGMSLSAGNELIKRGYQRVRDLSGGMVAWQAAGYPLVMDGGV
jgi:rhodanese-related sulfurtransferase